MLILRHNLDVMHIEKNVCDNIIGTLLDIEGKSKDNLKARKDLQDLNIREELWLRKSTNDKFEKPHATYTLAKEECKSFCKFIRSRVHLLDQVLLGGPVFPRWMFGTERHMGLYKRYVRNMARPDGSIADSLVVDEAMISKNILMNTKEYWKKEDFLIQMLSLKQKEEFPSWFKRMISQLRVEKSAMVNDDLYSLSQGPLE
ncbi:hypothetical protein POM88_052527 [Heracleum sosnowskyi]|uniref:DUF4218 domain-containing protein n=1 Tax=Heracleum sosnowskyi TaxID=360622 RepID=A0AAD8GQR3_9APIA|nr:hypothetical protein POM88_052527 [Heracleum sosnowskyi]